MASHRTRRPSAAISSPAVTKVQGPSDVVAIIPYLLGFDPAESIVVIGIEGPRQRFGPAFRLDIAVGQVDAQAEHVADLVRHLSLRRVIVAVFGTADTARPILQRLCRLLPQRGVQLHEALHADDGRWWSAMCTDPACCSPDGTAYDVTSSRVAAEAVLAGLQRLPTRDALRVRFAPDPARQAAVTAAVEELGAVECSAADVHALVATGLRQPESLEPAQVARLLLALRSDTVRDDVWRGIHRPDAGAHVDLWSHLMRCAPDELMAPAGSLAAFAAWLDGTGVLASHAVERVLAVAPAYSMARLVEEVVASALNPAVWEEQVRPTARTPAPRGVSTG